MAIWKELNSTTKEPEPALRETSAPKDDSRPAGGPARHEEASRPKDRKAQESVIAADLTIEGKIEGSGHVRLVGKFKGDVHVDGDLTIEPGAKVTGSVRASTVTIGGELEGNIEAASSVELLKGGVLNGDLKAGSLSVVAGSRMRGQADFGWNDKEQQRTPRMKVETGSTA